MTACQTYREAVKGVQKRPALKEQKNGTITGESLPESLICGD
jgi:hypothetical protein